MPLLSFLKRPKSPLPGRLARHITFDHGHPTIPCPVQGCSRLFSRSENAQKHFDNDHCENVFECHYPECNTKCISKHLLKDHVDVDHLGMKFACSYSVDFGCKKGFLPRFLVMESRAMKTRVWESAIF